MLRPPRYREIGVRQLRMFFASDAMKSGPDDPPDSRWPPSRQRRALSRGTHQDVFHRGERQNIPPPTSRFSDNQSEGALTAL